MAHCVERREYTAATIPKGSLEPTRYNGTATLSMV